MERREGKSRTDRREIHSVCMPVPTIILNSSYAEKSEHAALSHSRSAGDLDMTIVDTDAYQASGKSEFPGMGKFSSSIADGIQDTELKDVNSIGLYCSPRTTRRSVKASDDYTHKSGVFLESLNACNLNSLDTGSRVGSTVSLNSEYTSRSVGLISNDSNSECSHHHYSLGIVEGSGHKHSVLKRFYSTPEKDDELLNYTPNVRRNSKSMGNMQQEDLENFVSFDFGSESTTDDNFQHVSGPSCDIDESLAVRTAYTDEGASEDRQTERTLVTAVTGGSLLRDGRIRKWLTEISGPEENSNS